MATEADVSDLISPTIEEVEDRELYNVKSKVEEKVESGLIKTHENLQEDNITDLANVCIVDHGFVKVIEGKTFLQSPSIADGEVEKNEEENQLVSKEKMNGSQNRDKTDENIGVEPTDCSQPLEQKRDDDAFEGENESVNKSLHIKVENFELSKQKNKPEALETEYEHEIDQIASKERALEGEKTLSNDIDELTTTEEEILAAIDLGENKNGATEVATTDKRGDNSNATCSLVEEVQMTSEKQNQVSVSEREVQALDVSDKVIHTRKSFDENSNDLIIKEEIHAAIDSGENKNGATEVAVTDEGGDNSNATSSLVEEVQMITEKQNQVSVPEKEGQALDVIHTRKSFDENSNDLIIKEEIEETKETNKEEDLKDESDILNHHATECDLEDMASCTQEKELVSEIDEKEEIEETSTPKAPENKFLNGTEKSEGASSLACQAIAEEIYEEKLENKNNCVEKDLERSENRDMEPDYEVQDIQDVYETTTSQSLEEISENEMEKIIREVPAELPEPNNNVEIAPCQTIEAQKTRIEDETVVLESSYVVSESRDQKFEEVHEEISENNKAETLESTTTPCFHDVEEIKDNQIPISETSEAYGSNDQSFEETRETKIKPISVITEEYKKGEEDQETIKEPKITGHEISKIEPTPTREEDPEDVGNRKNEIINKFATEVITSNAEEIQEAKAFEPAIQSKAIHVEDIIPNQTLTIDSEDQLIEPCTTSIEDEQYETTTEVEKLNAESINKSDTLSKEETFISFQTVATENVAPEVTAEDDQNRETEEIDEENVEDEMKCDEGTDMEVITETEVNDIKLEEASHMDSQLLAHENEAEACENTIAEKVDAENAEVEKLEVSATESDCLAHNVVEETKSAPGKISTPTHLDEANEQPLPTGELEEHQDSSSRLLFEKRDETEESKVIHTKTQSNVLGVEEVHETETTVAEEEERTKKILETTTKSKCQDVGEINDQEVFSNQDFPLEGMEVTNIGEIKQNDEAVEDVDMSPTSKNPETTETVDTCEHDPEVEHITPITESKLAEDINKIEAHESVIEAKTEADDVELENLISAKSESLTSEEIHETSASSDETNTIESEKVVQEVPKALIEGVNQSPEADNTNEIAPNCTSTDENIKNEIQNSSSAFLSGEQSPENETATVIPTNDEVRYEEVKGSDAVRESIDHLQEIHETETSPTVEIYERNIEEKTKCHDGTDISVKTETEETHLEEIKLINEPIDVLVTSLTTTTDTIETIDTTEQDLEADIIKLETSVTESQFLAHGDEVEACESTIEDKTDLKNVEVGNSEVPATESVSSVHNVEEIHEIDTSPAVRNTETSKIERVVREVAEVTNREDSVVSQLQNIKTVEKSDVDVVKAEETTGLYAVGEPREHLEEIHETDASPNSEISGADTREGDIEGVAEKDSELLSEKLEETEESEVSETNIESNALGVEEDRVTETTADVEKIQSDKAEQGTKEALETMPEPKCQDVEAILDREILSNKTFPVESVEGTKDGDEETNISRITPSEVTSIEEVKPSVEASKDADISSEVESNKPEKASAIDSKLAEHENKIEARENATAAKSDPNDAEVENQKVIGAESECSSVEEVHEENASPVGEINTNESEEVREVTEALPGDINQGLEADEINEIVPCWTSQAENIAEKIQNEPSTKPTEDDSLKLQETYSLLSKLQNIETEEISDEVKAEEVKGFDAVCESKYIFEEIQEINTSPTEEKTKCNEGTSIAVTLLEESELTSESINAFNIGSESTIVGTIETNDNSKQGTEVDGFKLEETPTLESQLLAHENEVKVCETMTAEKTGPENVDLEILEVPATKFESLVHSNGATTLDVEEVIHGTNEECLPTGGLQEQELSSELLSEKHGEIEESEISETKTDFSNSQDAEAIINGESLSSKTFPLESVEGLKSVAQETDISPTSEATKVEEIKPSDEAMKGTTICSGSMIPKTIETADSEVESTKPEEASIVETKLEKDENKIDDHESVTAAKAESKDAEVENLTVLGAEFEFLSVEGVCETNAIPAVENIATIETEEDDVEACESTTGDKIELENVKVGNSEVHATESVSSVHNVEEIHEINTSPAVGDTGTSEIEKVVREEAEVINQEDSAVSQLQNIQTVEKSDVDVTKAEETTGLYAVCEPREHLEDTNASPNSEIFEGAKDGVEETDNAPTTPSETSIGEIKLSDEAVNEASDVDSKLADHETKLEGQENAIAAKTEPNDAQVENQGEESVCSSVKEIHEENVQVLSPGTDGTNEIVPRWTSQAENIVEEIQNSSSEFLSSEETRENEPTTNPKEDDSLTYGMLSKLQNIEPEEPSDEVKAEEVKAFENLEIPATLSESLVHNVETIHEIDTSPAVGDTEICEIEKVGREVPETVVSQLKNIETGDKSDAYVVRAEETTELSSELLSEKQDESKESEFSETKKESNVLGVEEVHKSEATTVVEKTRVDKVEEETKEALETKLEPKSQDAEVIIDREIFSDKNFPLESVEDLKDGAEETDISPTTASEVTCIEEIKPSDEGVKDVDICSDSKIPEIIETADICQQDSEFKSTKPEEASIKDTKLAEDENKIEDHESVTAAKAKSNDAEVESIEELENSISIFFPSGESRENEITTTKNTEDGSFKLQETSSLLSQLQKIETQEASNVDDVKAEEEKGIEEVYESKNHLEEIHETSTSPTAEISDEVKMKDAIDFRKNVSDNEAINYDVSTEESPGLTTSPTEKADIGANATHSVTDEPEEGAVSESITMSRVLDVVEIHEKNEDTKNDVDETDIAPTAVTEEGNTGKINPVDVLVKASIINSEIDKSQVQQYENEKIVHESSVEKFEESDVNGSVNFPNVEETKSYSSGAEVETHGFEKIEEDVANQREGESDNRIESTIEAAQATHEITSKELLKESIVDNNKGKEYENIVREATRSTEEIKIPDNIEDDFAKEKIQYESLVPAREENGIKNVGIKEQEATENAPDISSSKTSEEELANKKENTVDEKQCEFILDQVSIIQRVEEQVKDPTAANEMECCEEGKMGKESPETMEKLTLAEVASYEVLTKPTEETMQVTKEPKTKAEVKALVEEEKTDEDEEDEQKKEKSSSEFSQDAIVKTPHKKSHSILSGVGSKVKHSIAKVKKAITGKSSHQKSSSLKEEKKREAVPLL